MFKIMNIYFKGFLVNSYLSQLVPKSTRTHFGPLVPELWSTCTWALVNSYQPKSSPTGVKQLGRVGLADRLSMSRFESACSNKLNITIYCVR